MIWRAPRNKEPIQWRGVGAGGGGGARGQERSKDTGGYGRR